MPTISSIYTGTPEDMSGHVARHRQMGYFGHSVKIGALDSEGGPALDAERIATCLADWRPGEHFIVDANGGMRPETAMRMLRMLPHGLDFVLEAPCSTWREVASLRKCGTVPIIMDELAELDGEIARIVGEDIDSGIGLKISKAGGLTRGRRHRFRRHRASGCHRAGTQPALPARLLRHGHARNCGFRCACDE